jgi:hypothetical protein
MFHQNERIALKIAAVLNLPGYPDASDMDIPDVCGRAIDIGNLLYALDGQRSGPRMLSILHLAEGIVAPLREPAA